MSAMILRGLLMLIAFCAIGCFGGLGDINPTARPALTKQYLEYLDDEKVRKRVDDEWLESVAVFRKAGWRRPFHPWGDQTLASMGIPKVKQHKYSNQ